MKKKAIAIIPARGGSKRIPRKNIRPFCGEPIIKYSINAALQSGCFDEVMVSTDSEEIAQVAKRLGASIPFLRSGKTADDYSPIGEVALEVLEEYKKQGKEFDHFCCILPTAPFITAERIADARKLLANQDIKAVLAVVRYSYPIQRALVAKDGFLQMIKPENYLRRSQDFEETFHDAGQFYWLESNSFYHHKSFFPEGTAPYEISEIEVHDIDTEDDWKIAELKFSALKNKPQDGI